MTRNRYNYLTPKTPRERGTHFESTDNTIKTLQAEGQKDCLVFQKKSYLK